MSKTQQKNRSETEHLRGENKRLKSENRRLRKELRQFKKTAHMYENVIDRVGEHKETEEKSTCKSCGKGKVEIFDFVHCVVKTCDTCGHQRRTKTKGV